MRGNFKRDDRLAYYLFKQYQIARMNENDSELVRVMEKALSSLKKDEAGLLINEYLLQQNDKWWEKYYRKTTYYRHKSKATAHFLDYLVPQRNSRVN